MSVDVRQSTTPSQRVAIEIKVEMVRRGISGRRLATKLGVSQTWISSRLAGTTPIDVNDLYRIAAALGAKTQDLLPQDDEERITGSYTAASVVPSPLPNRPIDSRPPNQKAPVRPISNTRPHIRTRRIGGLAG